MASFLASPPPSPAQPAPSQGAAGLVPPDQGPPPDGTGPNAGSSTKMLQSLFNQIDQALSALGRTVQVPEIAVARKALAAANAAVLQKIASPDVGGANPPVGPSFPGATPTAGGMGG